MAIAVPTEDLAKQLFHTAPFNRMAAVKRFQLLAQAKSFHASKGELLFPEHMVPEEVYIILSGTVALFSKMPAEEELVRLEEQSTGECVGWIEALASVSEVKAKAVTEVRGLSVPAPAFLEIARCDPSLREAIFSKAWKGEIWRSVLTEMERRTGRIVSAAAIVEHIAKDCVAREWPEEQQMISEAKDRIWVVVGGEGARRGERWNGGDGVLWARLVGLPEARLTAALLEKPSAPAKVSIHGKAESSSIIRPKSASLEAIAGMPSARPQAKKKKSTSPLRTAFIALLLFLFILGSLAFWASRQMITRRISVAGRLIFSGDSRTLVTGVAGTLSEFHLRDGERILGGAAIAVVRPPFDEIGARKLTEQQEQMRQDLAYCESLIANASVNTAGVSPFLLKTGTDAASLQSDLRVAMAIDAGNQKDPALSVEEQRRVAAYFSNIQRSKIDRVSNVVRDASSRYDDLKEAEAALRSAQEDVSAHVQAFSGATTGDKESDAQIVRDYNLILSRLNATVARERAVVNRIRREISQMETAQRQITESVVVPSVLPEIERIQGEILQMDEELKKRVVKMKVDLDAIQKKLDLIRSEAAAKQIQAALPGYVAEASRLRAGDQVRMDTVLGRIITRHEWMIDCQFPSDAVTRMKPGQELTVTVADRYATLLYEPLEFVAGSFSRIHIGESRDEWRDGMAARIEATVSVGNLLGSWMEKIGIFVR